MVRRLIARAAQNVQNRPSILIGIVLRRMSQVPNRAVKLTCRLILMLGIVSWTQAQDNAAQQPSAREQLQHIHTPESIDHELAHLTKDLELTPKQQQQVRPLLQEHHDKIQALLDKNPKASRQGLAPQIHAISDETHRQVHALLTDHQKKLEKAMQEREHRGEENRRPDPPAGAQLEPSSSTFDLFAGRREVS